MIACEAPNLHFLTANAYDPAAPMTPQKHIPVCPRGQLHNLGAPGVGRKHLRRHVSAQCRFSPELVLAHAAAA